MAMEEIKISGWERSNISDQDVNALKKLGLLKKKDALIFPYGGASSVSEYGGGRQVPSLYSRFRNRSPCRFS
jgi:hypothetical protein